MRPTTQCPPPLQEGEALLAQFGLALPDPHAHARVARRVRKALGGARRDWLAAACQCLCIARLLHDGETLSPEAVLLGDYFQSRFTAFLLRLDAPWLQEAFSRFLARDAERALRGLPFDGAGFEDFAGGIAAWVAS